VTLSATFYYIKCSKIVGGWEYAPSPTEEFTALPRLPIAGSWRGREGRRTENELEKRGKKEEFEIEQKQKKDRSGGC